jgi:hypothetical protein
MRFFLAKCGFFAVWGKKTPLEPPFSALSQAPARIGRAPSQHFAGFSRPFRIQEGGLGLPDR